MKASCDVSGRAARDKRGAREPQNILAVARSEYVLLGEKRKAAHLVPASQRTVLCKMVLREVGCFKTEPRNVTRRQLAQRLSEGGSGAEIGFEMEF